MSNDLDDLPVWLKPLLVIVVLILLAAYIRTGCAQWVVADTVLATTVETTDRRPDIAAYIAKQKGLDIDPAAAANQLVWLESVGGAKAELFAAVVTKESGWYSKARNRSSGALGLGQILPSTARSVYGKLPESWGENLYQCSTYLQGCINAERRTTQPVRYGLCRYRAGPDWRDESWGDIPLAYAKWVLHERAKLP